MTTHLGLQRILVPSAQVSSLTTGSITLPSARGQFSIPGDYDSIATYTVGSGGQSFIEFTSIPQTYKSLELRISARGAVSNTHITTLIQANGDTGANYTGAELYKDGNNSGGTGHAVGETYISYGPFLPANQQSANIFGVGLIEIAEYTNTNMKKSFLIRTGYDNNATGTPSWGHILMRQGLWNSTSAITSLKLTPSTGSWAQYSIFALYGLRDA